MLRRFRLYRLGLYATCLAGVALLVWGMGGCASERKSVAPVSRYPQLPQKVVPDYFKDTIFARCDLIAIEPLRVTGYGLVGRLAGTGEGPYPTAVREYMIKEMVKHGFGSKLLPGFENVSPERVLADPSFAIVRVDGFIPPGMRQGQHFDVYCSAMADSNTSSLARGRLFRTDLQLPGANAGVNVLASCEGQLLVNPAYALTMNPKDTAARASLRRGVVTDPGGIAKFDRPVSLRLRQPQWSMTRAIEARLNERFQTVMDRRKGTSEPGQVEAMDEAIVHMYVPKAYNGDWEHFAGVATHLYMNGSPEFSAVKAKQLADAAVLPDAPLLDISYAWEGLDQPALPFIKPLMNDPRPEVAFAAARAAALIGDPSAQQVLLQMASTKDHPFQVNAVHTFGALPSSPEVNRKLRDLLSSDQTLVRLEAYTILARNRDSLIFSKVIEGAAGGILEERFVLDIVPCGGPPMVYATRTGIPRIAILGQRVALNLPLTFTALDNSLSISSNEGSRTITIYYRGPGVDKPVKMVSGADLGETVARLGGAAPQEDLEDPKKVNRLDFTYGDVVAILQALGDQRKLSGVASGQSPTGGARVPAAFVLQDLPGVQELYEDAPPIPELGRPQHDEPQAADNKKSSDASSTTGSRMNLSQ